MKIGPGETFYLSKGMKIKLKDGRVIELLSDYKQDGIGYDYKDENGTGFIVTSYLLHGEILEGGEPYMQF